MELRAELQRCCKTEISISTSATSVRSSAVARIAPKEFAASGIPVHLANVRTVARRLAFWLSLVIGPLLGRLIVDGVIDAGILHLVPRLFTPMNFLIGIGIRRVIGRVVVVCNCLQL